MPQPTQAPPTERQDAPANPETQAATGQPDRLDVLVDKYGPIAADYGVRIVGVIILMLVAYVVGGYARRAVASGMARARVELTLAKFFGNLARYGVLVLGVVTALGVFGVNTTSLAAVVGAAGLAIGLALQGALTNLAAGVMLAIFRPFRVGSTVVIDGVTGTVEEIDLMNTRINRPDNKHVIFPNSKVFGNVIEVLDRNPTRRAEVAVGVDYAADINATRQALLRAASRCTGQAPETQPRVILVGLGDSAVNWEVHIWAALADFGAARAALIQAIKEELDAAGLGIPFPQRQLTISSPVEIVVQGGQVVTNGLTRS